MAINRRPRDYQNLFLDMDSFFASVEQQVQPPLRGKPLGVAPYTGNTGCIIAASKEAKKLGIKTGFLVGEAKRLFPKIQIIEAHPALYLFFHNQIKKIIESCSPFYQPLSIDEFNITLSPEEQNQIQSLKLARKIKKRIFERVGDYLTCSIGIGPSSFLAKLAGEQKKPDGLAIVKLKNLKNFYRRLDLTDLTGINFQMEKRLKKLGIRTSLELFSAPLPRLTNGLGTLGRSWYFRLRGYQLKFNSQTKSIGHSHVLAPEFRNRTRALAVIRKLIDKAGYRIRKQGYQAQGVSISIKFFNGHFFHNRKKTPPFNDNHTFQRHIFKALDSCRWEGRPIYVAVSAFNLFKERRVQLDLLPELEKSRKISRTLDKINDRYGANTIYPASVFDAKEAAPDRIPFGQPRYQIRN